MIVSYYGYEISVKMHVFSTSFENTGKVEDKLMQSAYLCGI